MKVDHVVPEMDRTGGGAFDYVAAERPIESEHRASVFHRKGDMMEAADAPRLLSGERADTNRPTNGRTSRCHTPEIRVGTIRLPYCLSRIAYARRRLAYRQ
jgi:hypothetical protein